MIVVLVGIALVAIGVHVDDPLARARDGGLDTFSRAGWESIVVLAIAVTAANLFHQGYWQRTWSATDPDEGAFVGLPFIQMEPSIFPAGLNPERISRRVDFPAPEGPTMAHISPGTTAPVAGARICFGRSVFRSVTVHASLSHERSAG